MIKKVGSRIFIPVAPLERGSPRSSSTHRLPLERPTSRSSGECTLPEVFADRSPLARPTPCSSVTHDFPLERPIPRSSGQHYTGKYWMGVFPARASKPLLERTGQNLGNQTWFLSSTNLLQIFPTQPKTQNKKIMNDNNNYTMTESTKPKSGYNNHMGKDRGHYSDQMKQKQQEKFSIQFLQ